MVSRWLGGLRGGLIVCLIALGVAVAVANAKQVTTGHAEISGTHGNVGKGRGVDVFGHKNFARVRFICSEQGNAMESGLRVTNLENTAIRFTYSMEVNLRRSIKVKPHDSETVEDFTLTDVGITDLSHKYATLDIDWGQRADDESCDFAVHTDLHFPDGTPVNG
jgi:hypothetical protein